MKGWFIIVIFIVMLPSLRKINDADNRMADTYKENNQDKYHKLK